MSEAVVDRVTVVERHLRLTRPEVAHLVGVSETALESPVTLPIAARRRLRDLEALAERIDETFTPTGADEWLDTPNRVLRGTTPDQALKAGRFSDVDAALEAIDSGVYL